MNKVHCVGIGGIGISAIARVLLERGIQVTGSDMHLSPVAKALSESGAVVSIGHDAAHLGDADAVLISSAIPGDNPEVVEARRRGIPIYRRSEFLGQPMAQIMGDKIGIAVAGTHGKTTTTSMIAWILDCAGEDPTFIVGGVIRSLGTNARAGSGRHFVIEADEYDRMFLGLSPTVAAITHLEHDHPDCFPTFADMQNAFEQFVALVPPEGMLVGCGDQPAVAALLQGTREGGITPPRPANRDVPATIQSCGLGKENDWQATDIRANALGGHDWTVLQSAMPRSSAGRRWGSVRLAAPGKHNVQNALVALVVADWLGIDRDTIVHALATFPGVERRFEVRTAPGRTSFVRRTTGDRSGTEGLVVIDDYGHHPTEIQATLAAARARYGARPVWAVFQPHTYSRLRTLWDEFGKSFADADHVIVLDVYGARERDVSGSASDLGSDVGAWSSRPLGSASDLGSDVGAWSSRPLGSSAASALASALAAGMAHGDARHIEDMQAAAEYIVANAERDAIVITLSAGDGNRVGTLVLDLWSAQPDDA